MERGEHILEIEASQQLSLLIITQSPWSRDIWEFLEGSKCHLSKNNKRNQWRYCLCICALYVFIKNKKKKIYIYIYIYMS